MDTQTMFLQNKQLFEELDKTIREQELFTQHGLSREQLRTIIGVDRNRFAVIIREHSGAPNLCTYLNNFRMHHAVSLMRQHPNWTLRAIIEACGMTLTPFKSFFKDTFGMTPTEYRRHFELCEEDEFVEKAPETLPVDDAES